MTLLSTRRLGVEIGSVKVCRDMDIAIHPGEVWALLGRNGVGKTTLLHTLAGLRDATEGEVSLRGRAMESVGRRARARDIGLLFQSYNDSFPTTVIETVLMGRHPYLSLFEGEGDEDRAMAREVMNQVDLAGLEHRHIASLSGGERRRVDMATLMLQDPAVVLLDEPGNHLDLKHQMALIEWIATQAHARDKAVMLISHDINLALQVADHALLLFGDGSHQHGSVTDVVDADRLSAVFGYPLSAHRIETRTYYYPR